MCPKKKRTNAPVQGARSQKDANTQNPKGKMPLLKKERVKRDLENEGCVTAVKF